MSRRWLDSLLGTSAPAVRISRRELLQTGLAAAAGSLISASESRTAEQQGRGRKVLVVGAGFSGLACALELLSAGCEVSIVEARDRIGGRVHSFANLIPGKTAEAGGEFLGANHPIVLGYAATLKLELIEVEESGTDPPGPVILNGQRLSNEDLHNTRTDVDRALSLLTDAARSVMLQEPWNSPDAQALDRISTADWLQQLAISRLSKDLVAAQLVSNNGVALDVQSQLGNLAQIRGGDLERFWTDTERFRCRGGNDQFASRLAERLGNNRIILNTAVTQITTTRSIGRVNTATGQVYEADDVVLCIPPTTWSRIRFDPLLPQVLRPQMGHAVKFLSVVRDHFWTPRKLAPESTSYGGIGQTFLATANQDQTNPNEVLTSFLGGPTAQAWSKRPEPRRIADFQRELDALCPGFLESVRKTLFVDWLNQPWTGGGYSFPSPGQITTQGPILRNGIGRLHFAGEHTCYPFVGYMEGALRSGVEAARRILNRNQD